MTSQKDKNHPAIRVLKEFQTRREMTRPQLADRAGIGLGTLNKLMSGVIPSDETLRKIEERLHVTIRVPYQMVAHEDLGAYPRNWCQDLEGEYVAVRQNRWLTESDVINTYGVNFWWDEERPGLRMDWAAPVDSALMRRQSAYVSMTSRDGMLAILSNALGRITTTQLMRFDHQPDRLFGLYCGYGEVSRGHEAMVAQVVAYIRKKQVGFAHEWQMQPGEPGYAFFVKLLAEIDGRFCFMLRPPVEVPA